MVEKLSLEKLLRKLKYKLDAYEGEELLGKYVKVNEKGEAVELEDR